MSRFPKLTETFVLDEIMATERSGVSVEVFPLIQERQPVTHPAAARLARRAHYLPVVSPAIVRSHLWFLIHAPRRYLSTLWAVLRGTWGSVNFFFGALGIFPKVVHASRLMERRGVDHVHCHFANHPAVAGFIIHRLVGIPFSFTAHGSDLHVDRHMLPQKVAEASFVVAISNANRELILDECGERYDDKVHVVHCGVDTRTFAPVAGPSRTSKGSKDARAGTFTVLSVGTLHEVKGQQVLITACEQLAGEGLDLQCRLVGDGPDRARLLRRIRRSGLGDHVVLTGPRPREDVVAELRNADALAVPSVPTASGKREGIPVVIMEAMAVGVPVVASRLSGIPELVEDGRTGLLVEPGDASALADALLRIARDRDSRVAMVAAARQRVEQEFDLHANAARLLGLIEGAR